MSLRAPYARRPLEAFSCRSCGYPRRSHGRTDLCQQCEDWRRQYGEPLAAMAKAARARSA